MPGAGHRSETHDSYHLDLMAINVLVRFLFPFYINIILLFVGTYGVLSPVMFIIRLVGVLDRF